VTTTRLEGVALQKNQNAECDVDERNERRRVISSPCDDARMQRQTLRTDEKDDFESDEDCGGYEPVRDAVRTQQWDPDRKVVATKGQRDGERRDASSSILFARGIAVAPGVNGETEGCHAQQPNPANGNGGENRANRPGDAEQERHRQCLSRAHSSKALAIGDDKLCREREEVVEHGADEGERRDDNDADNRMHLLTLLLGTYSIKGVAVGFTRWFAT
jgi:hypothetical protein